MKKININILISIIIVMIFCTTFSICNSEVITLETGEKLIYPDLNSDIYGIRVNGVTLCDSDAFIDILKKDIIPLYKEATGEKITSLTCSFVKGRKEKNSLIWSEEWIVRSDTDIKYYLMDFTFKPSGGTCFKITLIK